MGAPLAKPATEFCDGITGITGGHASHNDGVRLPKSIKRISQRHLTTRLRKGTQSAAGAKSEGA
jgi:hypothetical protein